MRAGTSPPSSLAKASFMGISKTFKANKASLLLLRTYFVLQLRSLHISLSAANLDTVSVLSVSLWSGLIRPVTGTRSLLVFQSQCQHK